VVTSYRLSADDRAESLRRLATDELDLVVVGGGVVGAGAALDAATRGLAVALLERHDWASGTSSRSSRLAHGGLRYLEQLEFGLVREALGERGLLLERLAPHLVRPVPFILPLTRGWERPYLGAGVALYDALSRISRTGAPLRGHRHLSRRSVQRVAPGLAADQVSGAIGFYDAQIDDVRHTLAVVRTAASRGVLALSGVEVTGLLRDGERVIGVTGVDRETGQQVQARARVVLGAVGVWSDQVAAWLGRPAPAAVVPSVGVHLVVPRDAIRVGTAVIARTPTSVLFLLPWGEHWLVGTTDTEWTGDRDDPRATPADVDYLLDQANRWLSRPLTHDDVVGVYAGLRPLVAAAGEDQGETAKLSREHVVNRPVPGLVTVAGGKYTTYRVMAADAVDAAAKELPEPVPPSRTQFVPLAGAAAFGELWQDRERLARESGLALPVVTRLLRRHGSLAYEVIDLVADRPELGGSLHADTLYLRAEVEHAVTHEDARHLDDVLVRRTRLALVTRDGGLSCAADAAGLMAPLLGWDEDRVTAEVERFRLAGYGRPPPRPGPAGAPAGTTAAQTLAPS
jgi:glycerol-3-phosphate dehydrogenase